MLGISGTPFCLRPQACNRKVDRVMSMDLEKCDWREEEHVGHCLTNTVEYNSAGAGETFRI